MEKVRVKPSKLVEKLKENYTRHKQELAAARNLYLKKATEALTKRLTALEAAAKPGRGETVEIPNLYFDLSPPDDHTEDYERAISMLEMCEDETVTITATQFAAFVQDRWNWKGAFLDKNRSYMG
jgi:hypothetical protein